MKRKKTVNILLGIVILIVIKGCSSLFSDNTMEVNRELVMGEWVLDSSSNKYEQGHIMIITEEGKVYKFSTEDGGSLSENGTVFNKDSISWEHTPQNKIVIPDSNHLILQNTYTHFYRRTGYDDYKEALNQYQQQAELRKKVIGWWKLVKSDKPVELINYTQTCNNFTLNIREDGRAVFFLENYADSTLHYGYEMAENGMNLRRGCVIDNVSIFVDYSDKMRLVLKDTLLLERLRKIE